MNQKDIDDLEKDLSDFVKSWQKRQQKRVNKWRKYLFSAFVIILCLVFLLPQQYIYLWWLSVVLIGFSAGTLYKIINDEARTS